MTIPPDLQFQHPYGIFLMAFILAILFLFGLLARYRKINLQQFGGENVLPHILAPRSSQYDQIRIILLCLSWFFAVLALMGPEGNAHYPKGSEDVAANRVQRETLFLMDVSDSMSVVDTRVGRSRLGYAQEIADTLATKMAGEEVSLFTFTSEAVQQVPETMDILFLRLMIGQLQINQGGIPGTDFLTSFQQVAKALERYSEETLLSIVIFSDGGDTEWESLEGKAKQARANEIAEIFDKLNALVITVGMGSQTPQKIPGLKSDVKSKLDSELLKQIGDDYFDANDETPMGIVQKILEKLDRKTPGRGKTTAAAPRVEYDHYFQIPLFIALCFLMLALWIPETKKRTAK